MTDILARIAAYKRIEVEGRKAHASQSEIEAEARLASPPRGFRRALEAAHAPGRLALIAEIKQRSPSRGLIRPDFQPVELAKAYEAGGAACLVGLGQFDGLEVGPDQAARRAALLDLGDQGQPARRMGGLEGAPETPRRRRQPGFGLDLALRGVRLSPLDLDALVRGYPGQDVGHAGLLLISTSRSRAARARPSLTEAAAISAPARRSGARPATRKTLAAVSSTTS